ncbi:hypothetical protein OAO01_01010 [Oligoflexia bacterium]|nr:hypothetical protein [Oligoflexia bacterium]
MKQVAFILSALFLFSQVSLAEPLSKYYKKIDEYMTAKNYTKALEEWNWARKEIETLHMSRVKEFLPDELAGYKGGEFKANSALGFTNIERAYQGPGKGVKVSILGSSSGAGPMGGGLAAFGQMAAMMQGRGGDGQGAFRIGTHTASLNVRPGSKQAELSVFLENGAMIKLNGADGETLKKIANALKIDPLDQYLKGSVK